MDALYRHGFVAGKENCWCANPSCNREFRGGRLKPGGNLAFKCRPCAVKLAREVDELCADAGMEFEGEGMAA